AEEAYRKGMENDPADPWPAMGLAGVLETQGRLDEARQAAEEALHRDPSIQAARDMLNRLNQHGTSSTPSPDTPGTAASSTPPGRDQVPGDPGSIPASP
ncbi:MAG TPA: tetratricopeptide repeat protein, partial [Candidatus Hydrogenedentes bacterium]|nr:tetratricopeptide repeat protein [Candidatus Hydrogenedentota bacterium]